MGKEGNRAGPVLLGLMHRSDSSRFTSWELVSNKSRSLVRAKELYTSTPATLEGSNALTIFIDVRFTENSAGQELTWTSVKCRSFGSCSWNKTGTVSFWPDDFNLPQSVRLSKIGAGVSSLGTRVLIPSVS